MCEMKPKDEWRKPSKEGKKTALSAQGAEVRNSRTRGRDYKPFNAAQDREREQIKQGPDLEGLYYIKLRSLNFIL